MTFVLRQEDAVILTLCNKDEHITYPLATTVKTVQRGMASVIEPNSINGLAKIVCHGTSKSEGHFWYEYVSVDREHISIDVLELKATSKDGSREFVVAVDKFIHE